MKETNVWLRPEELKHMLQGSLQWNDVASRVTRNGIRKLSENILEKQTIPKQTVKPADHSPSEKNKSSKALEGKPVIWLLGGVGLLTAAFWFYYLLH